MFRKSQLLVCAASVCALVFSTSFLSAGIFSIVDDNSVATVDSESSDGLFDWNVDGSSQLFQQWFWYRTDSVSAEESASTLPIIVEGTTDTNFDGDDDTFFVAYDGIDFTLEIRLVLDGGAAGSGASDLAEQISITNISNAPLDFHFFQYADFDLLGDPDGDTAVFTNVNTVRQSKGAATLSETVVTPVPSHREIDIYSTTLDKLEDLAPDTLTDTPLGAAIGPDDVTWAFQWDVVIPAGGTFQISKDKNLVIPEPTSLALLLFGLLGLGTSRRR